MARRRNGLQYHTAGGSSVGPGGSGDTWAPRPPERSIWETMADGVRGGACTLEEAMRSARAMDAAEGPLLLAFWIGTDEAWALARGDA